jgi:hypothetical protein
MCVENHEMHFSADFLEQEYKNAGQALLMGKTVHPYTRVPCIHMLLITSMAKITDIAAGLLRL